jgi:hypothetical protein
MRLWHGEVAIEKADEYERFMIEKAAPDYGSVDGLIKLYFQRRNENKHRGQILSFDIKLAILSPWHDH